MDKVGALDDRVWREPMPRQPNIGPYRVGRPGRIWAVVGMIVVAALLAGIALWQRPSRPGGDPGNKVYGQLQHDLATAVPDNASQVRVGISTTAHWDTGCPEIPNARSGWSEVYITIQFIDASGPPSAVINQIASALERKGWVRHDTSPGPKQGKVPHWLLDVHEGHLANAFAFGHTTGRWFMSASWRPPGPVGQPCP